jgi:hypothetical protein
MAEPARMVFLGYGKYVRSDRIYGLEPIPKGQRGGGRRTFVWVEGIPDAVVASRTERAILAEMGQGGALRRGLLDDSLAFARQIADQADRVGPMLRASIRNEAGLDLDAVSRRARALLERTLAAESDEPDEASRLFDAEG